MVGQAEDALDLASVGHGVIDSRPVGDGSSCVNRKRATRARGGFAGGLTKLIQHDISDIA
jgi:hypothetical protein